MELLEPLGDDEAGAVLLVAGLLLLLAGLLLAGLLEAGLLLLAGLLVVGLLLLFSTLLVLGATLLLTSAALELLLTSPLPLLVLVLFSQPITAPNVRAVNKMVERNFFFILIHQLTI